ncbi:MAG: hypothetical protein ACXABN_13850 [Candidatus Thorarchaeota archaeon]|jgi:hypothetical protein
MKPIKYREVGNAGVDDQSTTEMKEKSRITMAIVKMVNSPTCPAQ